MKIIGLVGGVASGKSLVAGEFARFGARILDADRVGHDVLLRPAVRDALTGRWGSQVLDAGGEINRKAVAEIVFAANPTAAEERKFLEETTHPLIRTALEKEIAQAESSGATLAILDAALLFEGGWDAMCDAVLFVDAPEVLRRKRAAERGWSDAEFSRREAAQLEVSEKRRRADAVIDNSGSLEATREQVERVWNQCIELTDP